MNSDAPLTTILIIDDEPRVRETLESVLLHPDRLLTFAASGAEGLRLAHQRKPDLILLDVMMPELDGYAVCRQLRADPQLAEIPILMLTALDDRAARLKGLEAGADDFLPKPFDIAELKARVNTITGLSRYRKLLAGRARLEWMLDHSPDAMLVVDALLDTQLINRAARKLLRLPVYEEPAPRVNVLELLHGHFRCEPRKNWAGWLENPRSKPAVPLLLVSPATATAAASLLEVWVHAEPASSGDGILLWIRDVSATVMARTNQWSFQQVLAHKLKTPLTGVLGITDLLVKDMDPALHDPEVRHLLGLLSRSAEQMRRTVNDVLEYSLVAGQPLAAGGFALALLPDLMARIASETGVEQCDLDVDESTLALWLAFPPPLLEVVLIEICENAVKFHPDRKPRLCIQLTPDTRRNQLLLRVQDDGVNLSPDQLQRVIEPYYQAEPNFTGQVPGTGLGLPQVVLSAVQYGGDFWLENIAGSHGVAACLKLPLLSAASPAL